MTRHLQNAIRALAVLLVLTLTLSFVPQMIDKPIVENVAAAEDPYVHVGWLSTVVMWNPLNMEMVEDYVVCYLVYSALFTYDWNWEGPVNDLATGYWQEVHANGSMTTYINITTSAYFRGIDDPTDTSHPLTAFDVAWTFNLIKNNSGGAFDWYLEEISYVTAHERVPGSGVYDQVRLWCPYQKATLIDDISALPVLPQYHWEANGFDNQALSNMDPEDQIGSGPFMFESYSRDSWYKFKTAPNYFGEADYGAARTVRVEGVMYTVYGSISGMCLDLDKGLQDVIILTGDLNAFENAVGGDGASVNVIKAAVAENGITDLAINAIPDWFDQGGGYLNRHPALLDPHVRQAIMMTLNKPYIVNDMLGGRPIMGSSVVQPGYWQADIQNQLPYDPAGAKQLLLDNHWVVNSDGWLEATDEVYGVQEGWFSAGTTLTNIRVQAPDTDPNYGLIARTWPGWADDAGIQLIGTTESETTMINKAWYAADYDIWVWHWGWGPEPIGGALSVWLTTEIDKGGDNCQMPMGPWWAHTDNYTDCPFISEDMIEQYGIDDPDKWNGIFSAFDQNITDAMRLLDPAARKVILDKLQQWVYDSYTENPPYYDLGLYAYTDARFDNWGDWEAHNGLNVASDLPWIWFMLEPVLNRAPYFNSPPEEDYTAYKDVERSFSVTVSDFEGDALYVNMSFGDGSDPVSEHLTGDTTTPTVVEVSHEYTVPGTFILNVSLTDLFEGRYVYREAEVYVLSEANIPPEIDAFYPDNPSPSYVDEVITWTAVASDEDSGTKATGLKFTWDWGDGTYTVDPFLTPVADDEPVTSVQSHSWSVPDTYTVTVNVYDYVEGGEDGEHNASSSVDYQIVVNQPPTEPAIQAIEGLPGESVLCVASSSDPDVESLTFTWEWDDGTYDVQELTATYPNQILTSSVEHTWADEGTYDVIVWVEDEESHNVSSEAVATISADTNFAPSAIAVTISPEPIYVGVETLFNISARDVNGDAITFTVDFGDGSDPETATTDGGTTGAQYAELTHTYDEEGTYTVTVEASDGELTSAPVSLTYEVSGNVAPVLRIQDGYSARYSVAKTVTPIEVSDADGDALSVWYDWGDGTPMTAGDPATAYSGNHTYMAVGTFELTIYADDGNPGHNVTETATMTVSEANEKAAVDSIKVIPDKDEYAIGETITFEVKVSDLEGDNTTIRIEFGDGESDQMVLDLVPMTLTTLNFTHEYETHGDFVVNVTADDGQPHSDATLSKRTTTVTVAKDAGISMLLIAGIIILALIVIVAVALLMKRKKGGAVQDTDAGGMEGMAPPEEPGPPPA